MPSCCVVPRCSARKSGHSFPKDLARRKAWMVAIKRDQFVPTQHSRVCRKHFTDADYEVPNESYSENPKPILRKDAVPSVFAWSKPSGGGERAARAMRRSSSSNQTSQAACYDPDDPDEVSIPEDNIIDNSVPEQCSENSAAVSDEFNVQSEIIVGQDSEVLDQSAFDAVMDDLIDNGKASMDETNCGIGSETREQCKSGCRYMRAIHFIRDDKKEELKFYTGLDSYHFMLIFEILGPAVYNLKYYSEYSPEGGRADRELEPVDKFLMTLVKLRRNKFNRELGYMFGLSEELVTRIIITWVNFLYCQMKEIDIWPSTDTTKHLMKMRGEDNYATVIIDCTEIKIVQPKDPVSQQQTYSSYKGCNTVKILVGISPTGAIIFLSEVYGGSISDRQLFEKSGLIDLLQPGDVILADRGFNIQDLVCHKNIKVNIPDFVPAGGGQLKPHQRKRSVKLSSKRIHVERVIGLAKTYLILKGPLTTNLVPLASRIIYVCFMLANFRKKIV